MPWPPTVPPATATNATASTDTHPLYHNQLATAINDIVTRIDGRILAQSAVAVPHTGTLTETTLATITVPANTLGANGRLRVTSTWSRVAGGTSTATALVKFNGTGGSTYNSLSLATTNLGGHQQCMIANRNATNSQVGSIFGGTGGWGVTSVAPPTSAVDTTASTTVVIRATLGNTGDTITLESYSVEVLT